MNLKLVPLPFSTIRRPSLSESPDSERFKHCLNVINKVKTYFPKVSKKARDVMRVMGPWTIWAPLKTRGEVGAQYPMWVGPRIPAGRPWMIRGPRDLGREPRVLAGGGLEGVGRPGKRGGGCKKKVSKNSAARKNKNAVEKKSIFSRRSCAARKKSLFFRGGFVPRLF